MRFFGCSHKVVIGAFRYEMILIICFIKRYALFVRKPVVAGYFVPQFTDMLFCGCIVISELLKMLGYVVYQLVLAFGGIDKINNAPRVQNFVFGIDLALAVFG